MTTPFIKKAILGFVKPLVNKDTYKAFNRILSPCCNPSVTDITVECVSTGIYNISLNVGTSFVGNYANITIGNFYYLTVTSQDLSIVDASGIVTFQNIDLSHIGGADTYGIQLTLSIPGGASTNSSIRVVSDVINPINVDFPSC